MPRTATFPFTADPHVPAVDTASDGGDAEHVLELDGSPMMIAVYPANCDCVIESHVVGVTTVADSPRAVACWYSTLEVPPFTLVDKISTDPDSDAFAGWAAVAAVTAVIAAAPATTPAAGARLDASSDGTATIVAARRIFPER